MKSSNPVTVGELMTERLETITLLNTAQEAAIKMADKNVSSLAVLDDNDRPVGILTERDLVRRVCTKDIPSRSMAVQNVISSPVWTVRPDTSIGEAADTMVRNRMRHLLVTGDNNETIGIISASDIVAYVRENSEVMMQIDQDVIEALEKEGRFYF
jgi:signal-transduction protein with cAMP-binding, CBS, and nucleotidyltransferase domain